MSDNAENNNIRSISELRRGLDSVDRQLLDLYYRRLDIAREIGAYKRAHGLPVTDEEREEAKLASLAETAPEGELPAAQRLMRFLMEEAKLVQRRGLNVYLIGMPDCGKTRIGKRLSKLTGRPLADTDKLIMQRMGMSIDGIFAAMGEEAFRSMETMTLVQLVKHGGFIVATGGGLPLWGSNAELMKNSGVTVFLDRPLEALLGQETKNRPLLREGGDVNANIRRLYAERHARYAAIADVTVDPDSENAASVTAAKTAELINKL